MVQLAGHDMLKSRGIVLIAASAPAHFTEDTPTAVLVRQVLGAIAEFDKTTLVAELAASRKRKRIATGQKVEGRKSHAEARPEVVTPGQGAAAQAAEGRADEPAGDLGRAGGARLRQRARQAVQPQLGREHAGGASASARPGREAGRAGGAPSGYNVRTRCIRGCTERRQGVSPGRNGHETETARFCVGRVAGSAQQFKATRSASTPA